MNNYCSRFDYFHQSHALVMVPLAVLIVMPEISMAQYKRSLLLIYRKAKRGRKEIKGGDHWRSQDIHTQPAGAENGSPEVWCARVWKQSASIFSHSTGKNSSHLASTYSREAGKCCPWLVKLLPRNISAPWKTKMAQGCLWPYLLHCNRGSHEREDRWSQAEMMWHVTWE